MRANVHPSEWGPQAWAFLKTSAQACDASCAEDYEAFLKLLPSVLPCERCRGHAAAYLREHPVDTDDLPGWLDRFEAHVEKTKRRERSCGDDDAADLTLPLFFVVALVVFLAVLLRRT
jgi:hypothetical protein